MLCIPCLITGWDVMLNLLSHPTVKAKDKVTIKKQIACTVQSVSHCWTLKIAFRKTWQTLSASDTKWPFCFSQNSSFLSQNVQSLHGWQQSFSVALNKGHQVVAFHWSQPNFISWTHPAHLGSANGHKTLHLRATNSKWTNRVSGHCFENCNRTLSLKTSTSKS